HPLELLQLRDLAETGEAAEEAAGVAADLGHQVAHRLVAGDEVADLLLGVARAPRDAADARVVEHGDVAPLLGGHRGDHRLDAHELLLVDVDALRELAEEGELLEQLRQAAHLADGANLLDEVVEGELPGEDLRGVRLGLLLVDDPLEVFHQADDVAEAENAARQAVRAELLELVEALAHAEELDRLAGDLLDGEGRAAAGGAVELGERSE